VTPGRLVRVFGGLVVVGALATFPSARGQSGSAAETSVRPCGSGSDAVRVSGRWTRIAKPKELAQVTAHAAGGPQGKYLLVTDGRLVMRSIDAGCTWEESFRVEGADPTGGQLPTVVKLLYPERGDTAYMALDGVAKAVGSRLLRSDEHGKPGTWNESTGLPAVGGIRELEAGIDEPEIVYVALGSVDAVGGADPAGASGQIYSSVDAGRTFVMASAGKQVRKFAVDPVDGKNLFWTTRAGNVMRSTDFGVTALEITPPPDQSGDTHIWADIATYRRSTLAESLVVSAIPAEGADVNRVAASLNKGGQWAEIPFDGLGPSGGLMVVNGIADLYSTGGSTDPSFRGPAFLKLENVAERWLEFEPFGLVSLQDPAYVNFPLDIAPKHRAIVARRDVPGDPADAPDELLRFVPEPPPADAGLVPRTKCDLKKNQTFDRASRGAPSFAPERLELQLTPGVPSSAPLKAKVPGDPIPIDAYFLIDHSESMDPAIEALSCSIVGLAKSLPKAGIDVQMGLGAYNDIETYTYRRLVDIGPPSGAIVDALNSLFTLRGAQEPLRSALFQTATGAGLDAGARNPDNMSSGARIKREVAPGQQANFRGGDVLRTAIVIADEPYETGTEGEPAKEQVFKALKDKQIKTLGLRVNPYQNEQTNPSDPDHAPNRQLALQQQLDEFATQSGALAPKGGVDCDGGGRADVPEGGPIVCTVDEGGISQKLDDAIIALLRALAPPKPAEYAIRPKETSGLSVSLANGEAGRLDEHREQQIEDTATVSCTAEQGGRRYPLTFEVLIGSRVVGTLEGSATCGEIVPAVVPPPPVRTKKPAEPRSDPPRPAPERPVSPEPLAPQPPAAAQINIPQPAVAAAPPPPPPAPAPLGSVPAQAAAPSSAAAPAPGQGAAVMNEQTRSQVQVATVDGTQLPVEQRGGGGLAIVGRRTEPAVAVARREAFRPASEASRSALPSEALVTLGVGRPRRKRAIEPVRADSRRRRF